MLSTANANWAQRGVAPDILWVVILLLLPLLVFHDAQLSTRKAAVPADLRLLAELAARAGPVHPSIPKIFITWLPGVGDSTWR